ncbi:MAG: hypothetical protein EBU90_14365 [Proteobacteria bacterium]|nr:hypothetical protein [Pseudomonadota bacterium]NBP16015.1 hypothetical protein [bacterium]
MSIKRINQLPDGSGNLSNDDLFIFMDNPSSDGVTKKISLSQLSAYWEPKNLVKSETAGIAGASGINNIVTISKSDYDALVRKDSNTVYFVV